MNKAQFDIGILEGAGAVFGADGFKISVTSSQYLGIDGQTPVGDYGPWSIPAGRSLALYEIWLEAGDHDVTLNNLAGGGRLGVSIHGGAGAFARGSTDSTSGTAWLEPAGMDEHLSLVVAQSGYHALAVWKAGWADLEQPVQFSLHFTNSNVSGVVPGAGRLVIWPAAATSGSGTAGMMPGAVWPPVCIWCDCGGPIPWTAAKSC